MRRRLLWSALLLAGLLGRPAAEDVKTVPGCDTKAERCEDLNTCKPPEERLVVPEHVVLVLGNTGCGKSTLTKYLSRHDQDMEAVNSVRAGNGSRNFLITGAGIGATIQSWTTVPQMMTDHATSTHYFDCPGFEDTRGSCVEVSTTYYMKDITRHARSVKALLLAPYYALKQGQDREDFLKMLRHASRLLRADAKLSDSVGLVVTKVDAFKKQKVNGKKVKVPTDEAVVKTVIAKFLAEHVARHLETQMNGAADAEQREEFRRMAAVVAAVLRQDSAGNYTRIGIFRTPDSEGPIKSVKLVEDGRQGLLDLVHRTLRYAAVQPADFGFSVSDRTKLFALTQADKLSRAVVGKLTSLGASIAESRARQVYDHGDIPRTADSLLAEAGKLRRLAGDLKTSASVQAFCDRLTRDVQGGPEGAQAAEVAADARYLDVLQVVSDKPLVDGGVLASQWAPPFDEAADLLAAREHWNRFLVALYDRLNEYDGQRYLRDSAILPVSEANLTSFERVSSKLGLSTKLHAPASNVSDLNALLTRMGRKPQFVCEDDGRLVVYSESIILTQVAAAAHTHCTGGVQAVEVYALNTVFVDADVVLPGVSLAVLAPRWEVRGDSRIILNGLNGDPPAPRPREARDGARGADGVPGKPGKPGGNFLAVGLEVVGKGRVFLHGGDGGKGQDGAHGGPGRAGGGDGGDGGNGGKGGLGGRAGAGTLVLEAGREEVEVSAKDGAAGVGGRGGAPGDRRSFSGALRRRKRHPALVLLPLLAIGALGFGIYHAVSDGGPTTTPRPVPQYRDGVRGRDDFVELGRQLREQPLQTPWARVPRRLDTYLRLNLAHPYHREELLRFRTMASRDQTFTSLLGDNDYDDSF